MAISESKIVDLLFKKLAYGVTKTDDASRKSPSNEAISSPLMIRGDQVWAQSDLIPDIIPETSSTVVEVKSSYLGSEVECEQDTTSAPRRTWKTNLNDWIPVEFGTTYQIKVYVDDPGSTTAVENGIQIFADGTGSDEWYFDYSAGVLHFIGDDIPSVVTADKVLYITGARYVGDKGLGNIETSGSSAVPGTVPSSQTFVYNAGDSLDFTLNHTPSTIEAIDLYVNDVLQRADEVYTLTDDVLTLTSTPIAGSEIYIKYRYPFATVLDNPDRSIENRHLNLLYTSDQYVGNGTQQIYDINPGHNNHSLLVIVNGSILHPGQYTVANTTLTLLTPPVSGAVIDIRYMPV